MVFISAALVGFIAVALAMSIRVPRAPRPAATLAAASS
jgi:hypothetical protein